MYVSFAGLPAAARRPPLRQAAWEWRKESKDRQAGALQHADERDQRQADERSRIVGFHALDKRDAQTLGFGAARAVVRLLLAEIAFDHRVAERLEPHFAGDHAGLALSDRSVEQRDGGVEVRCLAAQRAQLADGGRMVSWLAEARRLTRGDLVRADDESVAESAGK